MKPQNECKNDYLNSFTAQILHKFEHNNEYNCFYKLKASFLLLNPLKIAIATLFCCQLNNLDFFLKCKRWSIELVLSLEYSFLSEVKVFT